MMVPQITESKTWLSADTPQGLFFYPGDLFSREEVIAISGEDLYEIEEIEGHGARLHAPGYMDSTEWSVFDNRSEAEDYLIESFAEGYSDFDAMIEMIRDC